MRNHAPPHTAGALFIFSTPVPSDSTESATGSFDKKRLHFLKKILHLLISESLLVKHLKDVKMTVKMQIGKF